MVGTDPLLQRGDGRQQARRPSRAEVAQASKKFGPYVFGGVVLFFLICAIPGFSAGEGKYGKGSCYKYTGGSCFVSSCNANRSADCDLGRCVCTKGCVGSDGLCKDITEYKHVGKRIRLRNMGYPHQYLYTPHTWFMQQVRTAGLSYSWYAFHWDVYELPGDSWVPDYVYPGWKGHKPGYLFVPEQYPDFAVGIATTKFSISNWFAQSTADHDINGGVIVPLGSQFVVDVYNLAGGSWKPPSFAPFDPALVQNSVCKVAEHPEHPGAIQIRGGFGQVAWYEHIFSWEVFGYQFGDPDTGGYWIPYCQTEKDGKLKWEECQLDSVLPDCPTDENN